MTQCLHAWSPLGDQDFFFDKEARPMSSPAATAMKIDKTVENLDGTKTFYEFFDASPARMESLFRDLYENHWNKIRFGPAVRGAIFELALTEKPAVRFSNGYLTVDPGPWHFHLCVGEYKAKSPEGDAGQEKMKEDARQRRVAKAAFMNMTDAAGKVTSWGMRFWNGLEEQMITVFLPNPYRDDKLKALREPDWSRLELWENLRKSYLQS